MAKIKKLKENGSTIYPATIPEGVVDTNGFTLAEFMDELLEVLAGGSRGNMELAFSDLREAIGSGDGNDLSRFVAKVNAFLEDADASDTTINRWKEIESFLTGITDTKTLTGLLADNLQSAKSYADGKVSSGTANMVTMSANAGATDRVLTSAGNNKTAKDSGVAIGDLAKKDLSNVDETAFKDKDILPVVVVEYSMSGDSIDNFNSFATQVTGSATEAAHGECILFVREQNYDVMSPVFSIADNSGAGLQDVLFISPKGRLYRISQDDDTGSYNSSYILLMEGATTSKSGLMSAADKAKLDGIDSGANNYTLPVATTSALGGVKSGGFVNVASDGSVTVQRSLTADNSENDENGDNIVETYVKKTQIATSSAAGLVKSGGNISVAADGTVTVSKATASDMSAHATEADRASYATSSGSATKATQDKNGADIAATYLKAEAVTDVTDYPEITI